ncbi:MAG: tryptophan-rich sensory protein [Candidatus Thorarchaeota archaeon]
MIKKKSMQILNFFGFIATVVVNFLAVGLPINNKTTQELSDNLPNFFVPAGITFSIWSVIYILLGIFAVYQGKDFFKSEKEDLPFLDKISYFFILSSVANVLWIFFWHYEQVLLSLIIMFVLFASLLLLYLRLGIGKEEVSKQEKRFIHVPISVYFGWITTATVANITAFFVSISWNGFGVTEEIWTVIVLVVVALLYVLTVLLRKDVAYGLVGIWSTLGIFIKQIFEQSIKSSPVVGYTALIVLIVIGVAIGKVIFDYYRK